MAYCSPRAATIFADSYHTSNNLSLRLAACIPFNVNAAGEPNEIDSKEYFKRFANAGFDDDLTKAALERILALLHGYREQQFPVKLWKATTGTRLLVGMGRQHITENSLYFHHTYGLPYIPASAIKGTTRQYVVDNILYDDLLEKLPDNPVPVDCLDRLVSTPPPPEPLLKDNQKEELNAWIKKQTTCRHDGETNTFSDAQIDFIATYFQAEEHQRGWKNLDLSRRIFGTTASRGQIEFFDALPQSGKLEVDILSPHYGEYYRDQQNLLPPADYLQPVPIMFPAVAADSRFIFAMRAEKGLADKDFNTAAVWLKSTLEADGLGSKTSIGYGWFKDISSREKELLDQYFLDHLPEDPRRQLQCCLTAGITPRVNTVINLLDNINNHNDLPNELIELLKKGGFLKKTCYQEERIKIIWRLIEIGKNPSNTIDQQSWFQLVEEIITNYGTKKQKNAIKILIDPNQNTTSKPQSGPKGDGAQEQNRMDVIANLETMATNISQKTADKNKALDRFEKKLIGLVKKNTIKRTQKEKLLKIANNSQNQGA